MCEWFPVRLLGCNHHRACPHCCSAIKPPEWGHFFGRKTRIPCSSWKDIRYVHQRVKSPALKNDTFCEYCEWELMSRLRTLFEERDV